MSIPDDDPFEAAYTAGVTAAIAAPDPRTLRAAIADLVRAAPAEPVALKGMVVTPDQVLSTGYVVVGGGDTIQAVQKTKPAGALVHETDGVICPGLIDLHGHPEFNVFAAWEPPQQFPNRYAWRGSDLYHTLVRDPQNKIKKALSDQTQLRYAEIRALVGGVTAIQGTSEDIRRLESEELVRNVDKQIFGQHRARAVIDLPSGNFGKPQWDKIWTDVDNRRGRRRLHPPRRGAQRQRALGRRSSSSSSDLGGAAQGDRRHPRHRARARALRRDGRQGRQARLVAAEQPAAVLRDDEGRRGARRRAARRPRRRLAAERQHEPAGRDEGRAPLPDRAGPRGRGAASSSQMVTSDAAAIAGLADKLGRLDAGRPADLVVFERRPNLDAVREHRLRRPVVGRDGA